MPRNDVPCISTARVRRHSEKYLGDTLGPIFTLKAKYSTEKKAFIHNYVTLLAMIINLV